MTAPSGPSPGTGALIALDWGSSSLRAYLLSADGVVIAQRDEPSGILQVQDREFAAVFRRITQPWRAEHGAINAIASGMIGSTQGWVEAPYCAAPAGPAELAQRLMPLPAESLSIVPGVRTDGDSPNVMRGEETQIVGALREHPQGADRALLVLPGTHSKWVRIVEGRVHAFGTFMTGELFAVLRAHSILGRPAAEAVEEVPAEEADAAFAMGVNAAWKAAHGLMPLLFGTRSLVLTGRLGAAASLSYLSGLLIGEELRSGLAEWGAPDALVGDPVLCGRYLSAMDLTGLGRVPVVAGAAASGLWSIAARAGLIATTPPKPVA